jgi:hypothetical protein
MLSVESIWIGILKFTLIAAKFQSASGISAFFYKSKFLVGRVLKELNIQREVDPHLRWRCISLDRQLMEYRQDGNISDIRSRLKKIPACNPRNQVWFWESLELNAQNKDLDLITMDGLRRIHLIEAWRQKEKLKELKSLCHSLDISLLEFHDNPFIAHLRSKLKDIPVCMRMHFGLNFPVSGLDALRMEAIWRINQVKAKREDQRVKALYRLKMKCDDLDSTLTQFESDPFVLEIKSRLKLNSLCTEDYQGCISPMDENDLDQMIIEGLWRIRLIRIHQRGEEQVDLNSQIMYGIL